MRTNQNWKTGQAIVIGLVLTATVVAAVRLIPAERWTPSLATARTLLTTAAFTAVLAVVAGVLAAARGRTLRQRGALNDLPPIHERLKRAVTRVLSLTVVFLAGWYMYWRFAHSLSGAVMWVAVPLLVAEVYAVIDTVLLAFMMWKPTWRVPPAPIEDASVDVFIATINEPIDILRRTIAAAMQIDWQPLEVYVLDDGNRPEVAEVAAELGCTVITRGSEWDGKPRHAKAGNVNNALAASTGEFILILDADQIPLPQIVTRTLGYFRDPRVAFVQTPQEFYNLPPGDPFGSDAPLFYGPILRGKDGWNAAFFCGSNAVLRRDALMQVGLIDYAEATARTLTQGLRYLLRAVDRALVQARADQDDRQALRRLQQELREIVGAGKRGEPAQRVVERIDLAVADYRRESQAAGLSELNDALGELAGRDPEAAQAQVYLAQHLDDVSVATSAADWLEVSESSTRSIERDREALPIQPLATTSVTEDMATSVRLHSQGWKSVYHHEALAYGLAPEDLGTALKQRLRWAQGTIQVLLREKPLTRKGLTLAQRLQYFTTIYSYFGGFASLIFLLLPVIYLFTGIAPVNAFSVEFLWHLVPYLVLSRVLFKMHALGTRVRRGEQYSLGLFPVWIKATVKAFFGRRLSFAVTSKVRQEGNYLRMIVPQLVVIGVSAAAVGFGAYQLAASLASAKGILVNMFWASYNIVLLFAIVRAATYRPPASFAPIPPGVTKEITHVHNYH